MKNIGRLLIGLVLLTGCQKEEILDLGTNQTINENTVTDSSGKTGKKRGTINVQTIYDPIFLAFFSGNTMNLQAGCEYIFHVPIKIWDLDNFTLNGNGATITFPFNGIGIDMQRCTNTVIQDFTVNNTVTEVINNNTITTVYYSDYLKGRFHIQESSDCLLDSITMGVQGSVPVSNQSHMQIVAYNSDDMVIQNCHVESSIGELIVLNGCNDSKIIDCKTFGGWSGISTQGNSSPGNRGNRSQIIGNEVLGASTASITINDKNTLVEGNTITAAASHVGGPGIRFGHIDHSWLNAIDCTARGNTISGFHTSSGSGGSTPTGIKVDAVMDGAGNGGVTIDSNTITDCTYGINVSNQLEQEGDITNNTIQVKSYAISIFSGLPTKLANFNIIGNNIESDGSQFMANQYPWVRFVVRFFHSHSVMEDNTITLTSSDSLASVIMIQNNPSNAAIRLESNTLNLNRNVGIFHASAHLNNAHIEDNSIYNSRIGMMMKCDNSLVVRNKIPDAQHYGIFLNGGQGSIITQNTISVSYSAAIRMESTSNLQVASNHLTLLAGSSQYAVYKSGTNMNPSIFYNIHNWPYEHN